MHNGILKQPQKCSNQDCKNTKSFRINKKTAKTKYFQKITVCNWEREINQKQNQAKKNNFSQINKSNNNSQQQIYEEILCELSDNLIDTVICGDLIQVNGVLKTNCIEDIKKHAEKQNNIYSLYLEVNSIISFNGSQEKNILNKEEDEFEEFTNEDFNLFEKVADYKNAFPVLIKSFCPTVFGQELTKACILLTIISGTNPSQLNKTSKQNSHEQKFDNQNANQDHFRSNCHLLLIGDQGLEKTKLIQFAQQISPRSLLVQHKYTNNGGLIATIKKEASNDGEGSLEAGTLVLCDKGVCYIDEFDKMTDDHNQLMQSLNQQYVTISQNGKICKLRTRTSVIAAANPVGGKYNKQKNIMENLNIKNSILSQFDLIFLMQDQYDPNRDQKFSEHIIKMHLKQQQNNKKISNSFRNMTLSQFQVNNEVKQLENKHKNQMDIEDGQENSINSMKYVTLKEKLAYQTEKIYPDQLLQPQYLKKYIQYVRNCIHVNISLEASQLLKEFYLDLRERQSDAPMPITNRYLESLIRLSQARTKLDQRTCVTAQDAFEVIQLMQESLFDVQIDDSFTQNYKINNINNNVKKNKYQIDLNTSDISGLAKLKQKSFFIEKLKLEVQRKIQLNEQETFSYSELSLIAKSINLNMGYDFGTFIEKLSDEFVLLYQPDKKYKLTYDG